MGAGSYGAGSGASAGARGCKSEVGHGDRLSFNRPISWDHLPSAVFASRYLKDVCSQTNPPSCFLIFLAKVSTQCTKSPKEAPIVTDRSSRTEQFACAVLIGT